MQCPACNHEASPESFGSPAKCPHCGVYYDKALALKQRREEMQREAAKPDEAEPKDKLKSAWLGAKVSVEEGRKRRASEEQAKIAARSAAAAKPVVVTDIEIRFGSLVVLLVKLAFAAIPAAIIVTIIIWGLISILSLPGLLIG